MLPIQCIKNRQLFYGKSSKGEAYQFRAAGDAYINDQKIWVIECTDDGDYCYTFIESDEDILYSTPEMK